MYQQKIEKIDHEDTNHFLKIDWCLVLLQTRDCCCAYFSLLLLFCLNASLFLYLCTAVLYRYKDKSADCFVHTTVVVFVATVVCCYYSFLTTVALDISFLLLIYCREKQVSEQPCEWSFQCCSNMVLVFTRLSVS